MKKTSDEKKIFYQLRVDVNKLFAQSIREKGVTTKHPKLHKILKKHNAIMVCQYDAFKNFVNECEKNEDTNFPLYKWTKDVIQQKEKKEKYKKSFTIYVDNEQLYKKDEADLLEKDLNSICCPNLVKIHRYDSNPANNPQPPKKYY